MPLEDIEEGDEIFIDYGDLWQEAWDDHVKDWEKLKRLGRHLVGRPRVVVRCPYQDWDKGVRVYSDTDFAGCKETRKSTSGGIFDVGNTLN